MPTARTAEKQPETYLRLVGAAARLFSRHGYAATGVKAVLSAAEAPYGSLYHFFPGGKQELGIAAVEHAGNFYRERLEERYVEGGDLAKAAVGSFNDIAKRLKETDFADACPIATVALEVASSDEPMRIAAASVYESWLDVLESRLRSVGLTQKRARGVAVEVLCLLEGAALLSRTTRSQEPLKTAARTAGRIISDALAERSGAAS